MTKVLEIDEVRSLAAEVVADRGATFRYATPAESEKGAACAYVPTTDPRCPITKRPVVAQGASVTGCLVGEIFKRAGVLTDDIATRTTAIRGLIHNLHLVKVGTYVERYLSALQRGQDTGSQWGQCLKNAESGLRNDRDIDRAQEIKDGVASI